MSGSPLVTIAIAVRDRLPLLRSSLASAQLQTYSPYEILIVDDGSGPEAVEFLDEVALQDTRVRVCHQEHQGIGAARQQCLLHARGEFVCILDSDDRLAPDALTKIVRRISSTPAVDIVYTDNWEIDRRSRRRFSNYPSFNSSAELAHAILVRPRVPFKHSGTTFRRDFALSVGGYSRSLEIKIDLEFVLRCLARGARAALMKEGLVEFVTHSASVSRRRIRGIKVWLSLIDQYGPPNPGTRLLMKCVRSGAECSKLIVDAFGFR
jgi:glycosyltransferase involved in cell wall biosynthesis